MNKKWHELYIEFVGLVEKMDADTVADVTLMATLKLRCQDNPQIKFTALDWLNTSAEIKTEIARILAGHKFKTHAKLWEKCPRSIREVVAYLNGSTTGR